MKINLTTLILFAMILLFGMCKDPEIEKKIDAHLKAELMLLKKNSNLDKEVTILFKANETLTALHYAALEKLGVKITANIGDTYTANVSAKSLYDLAKLKFIDIIQGQKNFRMNPVDSDVKKD